jgi:hypothetical protein
MIGKGLMDTNHFDDITKLLTALPSRRDMLRGLVGAGLGLGALRFADTTAAKKKHKRGHKPKRKNKIKQPQPVPNQFGCLEVGQPCRGDSSLCCSGLCDGVPPKKGKPDTRVCAAHDIGTCDQAAEGICTAADPQQSFCNQSNTCFCIGTTAGSKFCAKPDKVGLSACVDCQKDTDCEALGFAAGSACIPFTEGLCSGICDTSTVCLPPCAAS